MWFIFRKIIVCCCFIEMPMMFFKKTRGQESSQPLNNTLSIKYVRYYLLLKIFPNNSKIAAKPVIAKAVKVRRER